MRREHLAVWPDQAAAASAPSGFEPSTKLFHQTVHALSAQLCKTRRNIGVSRGKHHSNKTAFSIAFFALFSAFFPHFSAFFANPGDRIPTPPPCTNDVGRVTQGQGVPDHQVLGIGGAQHFQAACHWLCFPVRAVPMGEGRRGEADAQMGPSAVAICAP